MKQNRPPPKAHEPEANPADKAFGAVRAFVEHLATLAYHARHFQPRPDKPDAWKDPAMTYAMAFVAWLDLSHLLTPAVRTEARRVYLPGSPAIKLGKAKPTVIEAVADELGVYFRNTVYAGRRHPLEPDLVRVADEAKARATARQVAQGKPAEPFGWGADFDELMKKETRAAVRERMGIKTLGDGLMLMVDEWKKQDRERGESALSLLRCGSIDFDDLQTQLTREAEAVIAAASKPNTPMIDPAQPARKRTRRVVWLAKAMLTVQEHPEWSDAAIAKQVNIDKSRLSRTHEYRAAARLARTPKTPNGSVTIADGDRRVEAVDDSCDLNRPASRQRRDEEELDNRIDHEMKKRNAPRNARR